MKACKLLSNFIYLLFALTFFIKCTAENNKNRNVPITKKEVHTIVLPDSLVTYNPFNSNLDSQVISNSSLKIYSFIDVSCPSCLSRIKNFKNFAVQLGEVKIPVVLICQSEDNFELLKYLSEEKQIPILPFPLYFDIKKQFFDRNQFLNPAPGGHTVLTDKNNKVLVSGDMTLDAKVKKMYLDTIKAHY